MHQTTKMQFERVAAEYAAWRAVPEDERSPAPAWWWGPAMDARDQAEMMPAALCASLELPPSSSWHDASRLLMQALADQTSVAFPDDFPKKPRQAREVAE